MTKESIDSESKSSAKNRIFHQENVLFSLQTERASDSHRHSTSQSCIVSKELSFVGKNSARLQRSLWAKLDKIQWPQNS